MSATPRCLISQSADQTESGSRHSEVFSSGGCACSQARTWPHREDYAVAAAYNASRSLFRCRRELSGSMTYVSSTRGRFASSSTSTALHSRTSNSSFVASIPRLTTSITLRSRFNSGASTVPGNDWCVYKDVPRVRELVASTAAGPGLRSAAFLPPRTQGRLPRFARLRGAGSRAWGFRVSLPANHLGPGWRKRAWDSRESNGCPSVESC